MVVVVVGGGGGGGAGTGLQAPPGPRDAWSDDGHQAFRSPKKTVLACPPLSAVPREVRCDAGVVPQRV